MHSTNFVVPYRGPTVGEVRPVAVSADGSTFSPVTRQGRSL